MQIYNYEDEVMAAVREYIDIEQIDVHAEPRDVLTEELHDEMIDSCWYENDVTDQEAEFYLAGNWELLEDALDELGIDDNPIKHGAAWCDSVIREYVLPMAIDMVLDEMEEEE